MWLPWRRQAAATEAAGFDALIDVDPGLVGVGAVRAAVQAVPGARWISVERYATAAGVAVRLFPAGSSEALQDAALQSRVEAAVRGALVPVADAFPMAAPAAAGGFAEALSPTQFDALTQLAALASQTRDTGAEDAARAARLLGFVLPEGAEGAEAVAARAVRRFGSYPALLAAPAAELRQVPGLGLHSVAAIKLVHAAAVRLARAGVAAGPVLADPGRLADYLAAALARERIEQFRILFLDARGMLKADEVQATGTVNHTPVYPREVVRRALELDAAALVLVHNHPSGDPEPSREDVMMTHQVQAAAAAMGLEVRDHVIVGNGRWLSFRAEGLLRASPSSLGRGVG